MKELYGIAAFLCVETLLAAAFLPPDDSSAGEMLAVGVVMWALVFAVLFACHGTTLAFRGLCAFVDSLPDCNMMQHSQNPYQSPSSF